MVFALACASVSNVSWMERGVCSTGELSGIAAQAWGGSVWVVRGAW